MQTIDTIQPEYYQSVILHTQSYTYETCIYTLHTHTNTHINDMLTHTSIQSLMHRSLHYNGTSCNGYLPILLINNLHQNICHLFGTSLNITQPTKYSKIGSLSHTYHTQTFSREVYCSHFTHQLYYWHAQSAISSTPMLLHMTNKLLAIQSQMTNKL